MRKPMARTHAQEFANNVFAGRVFADPVGTVHALATDPVAMLTSLWDQAGADLPPIARTPPAGLTAAVQPIGRYTVAIVTLPPPRDAGDPVLVAVVGRGDGVTKLSTIAYYTLELAGKIGAPTTSTCSFTAAGARVCVCDGPLPEPTWFAEHVLDLYSGVQPGANVGVPELPFWYWWFAFDGASAFQLFNMSRGDAERLEAVRKTPILLLHDIEIGVEAYSGTSSADKLRELRPQLRSDKTFGDTWKAAIDQIVRSKHAPPATTMLLALPLVVEASEHGALAKAQAYEIEAKLRGTLAGFGVDAHDNALRAHELYALAEEVAAKRTRRATKGPPIEDPLGAPLFLDQTELPDHQVLERNDTFAAHDATFLAHGGLHAGYVSWGAPAWLAIATLIDARWVFRTAGDAARFMAAIAPALGEGLPAQGALQIGDQVLSFGDDFSREGRMQILAVLEGRVVIRLKAIEGVEAASSRQMLHAQMLYPLAGKAAKRAHNAQLRYWHAVEFQTHTIATLVHTPHHDVGRLLASYPLLAMGELPELIRLRADDRREELDEDIANEEDPAKQDLAKEAAKKEIEKYKNAADTLGNFQAQLRAHRWQQYRDAMLALTRMLLASNVGDPRVNAARAHEIVHELRHIDPDPVWEQLAMLCRSRAQS
jgi:hypothetical protein